MLRPKQWNRGGGQQMMSSGVSRIAPPTYWALLIRFLFAYVKNALDDRMRVICSHMRQHGSFRRASSSCEHHGNMISMAPYFR